MRKLQQAMIAAAVAAGSLSVIGAGTGTAYADGHGHGHSHGHGQSHSAGHGHSHTASHRSVSTVVERSAPKAAAPHRAHQEHGHANGAGPKATEHYRPYQECSPQTVADGSLPVSVLGLSETFDTTCGQFNNAFTA
ncbi:hypothetical protein [Streptomyces sp. NPDC001401]|uniref:hypothetical protein n=1 Tax=Streptomyces sp. NPDC001401 TaxID=3364570 RepID=UPI0036CB1C09